MSPPAPSPYVFSVCAPPVPPPFHFATGFAYSQCQCAPIAKSWIQGWLDFLFFVLFRGNSLNNFVVALLALVSSSADMGWLTVSITARGEGPEAEMEGRDSSSSLLDLMPLLFLCLIKVTTATTTKMRAVTRNAASELAVTRGVAVERQYIIFHMQLYRCFKFFKKFSAFPLY